MTGQSRGVSFAETIFNTTVGFAINFVANLVILPHYGFPIKPAAAFSMGLIFTAISVGRGFVIRRLFNYAPFAASMEAANAVLNRYLGIPYSWLKTRLSSGMNRVRRAGRKTT